MSNPQNFYTLLFNKPSLYMNQTLETQIATLVNTSFQELLNFKNEPRFTDPSDVSKELGDEGIIAIAFDPVPDTDRDVPIACVSAKKKEPPPPSTTMMGAEETIENAPHYQIYDVASQSSPLYRKKGLISLCLTALRDALPPNSVLWLETSEAANGPYWRKKRVEMVWKEMKPAGFWGAESEFEWVVLRAR